MAGDKKPTTMLHLSEPAPGFPGYSRYQVITIAMMDNIRHLGEICLIKSLWQPSSPGVS